MNSYVDAMETYAYAALVTLLSRRLGRDVPVRIDAHIAEETKHALLLEARAMLGEESLVVLGAEIARETEHPFVQLLVSQPTPVELVRCLERLNDSAHSHNRLQLLAAGQTFLRLRRFRSEGHEKLPWREDDLFVLGILKGLLSRIAFDAFEYHLETEQENGRVWLLRLRPGCAVAKGDCAGKIWCVSSELERTLFTWLAERAIHGEALDLPQAARALGMSSRGLQRQLKARETTFRTLQRAARVTAAGREIIAGERRLTELALRLGFSDGAHMCREFRAILGSSPRQFVAATAPKIGA